MKLHYGSPCVTKFDGIIGQYPDADMQKMTRSTIPMLAFWQEPNRTIQALASRLGVSTRADSRLCFEFPVRSIGRAKSSFTDVMYFDDDVAIGVEAKHHEPLTASVSEWIADAKEKPYREEVLRHWVRLIRSKAAKVNEPELRGVVYQMVHRAASVCAKARNRGAVVYQIFDDDGRSEKYRKALGTLVSAIGFGEKISVLLHIVPTTPTVHLASIERRLASVSGREAKAEIVRAGLLDVRKQLFTFGPEQFEFIHHAWRTSMMQ